jgi:hypothetical protein
MLGGSLDLTRWDIAARQETVLAGGAKKGGESYFPSLDDRWLFQSNGQHLSVRPVSGGDWRPLVTAAALSVWFSTTNPDGTWALYLSTDAAGKPSLFRVPIAGGQPERLGDFPDKNPVSLLRLSPDGRQVIAEIVKSNKSELWLLDNFVPPAKP